MVSAALQEQEDEKKFAEESIQTKRAREKLKKQFEELERKITTDAIKKKSQEIHRWITRHANTRVALREKNISLFDENQNAAKVSSKIAQLSQKIKETNPQ